MGRERSTHDSDDGSEYDTDTDCEHIPTVDDVQALMTSAEASISEAAVLDTYRKQQGLCRITGIPFDGGMYQGTLAPRRFNDTLSDSNHVIVLDVIARMRAATGMNWRSFVRTLQQLGKEADL